MNSSLRVSTARAVIEIMLIGFIIHGSAGIVPCFNAGNFDSEKGSSLATQEIASKHPPLMLDQIRELIPILPDVALAGEIESRGINFKIEADILQSLGTLKAGPQTIRALTAFISNRPPTVGINLSQTDAEVGQQVLIHSDASDPDGDPVQYYWAATAGRIYGEGPTVKLDTSGIPANSNNAQVTISVSVIDRRGGSDSYSKAITVRRSRPEVKPVESEAGRPSAKPSRAPVEPVPVGSVWIEDKLVLVEIDQGPGKSPTNWGFIEVKLSTTHTVALLHTVTGRLPGVACRVEFVNRENISEYSFKEPPGIFNEWRKMVVRVRPKVANRPMRFAISWQTIENR